MACSAFLTLSHRVWSVCQGHLAGKTAVPAKLATVELNLCKQMLTQTFSRNRRANVRRCAGSHFPTANLFTRPHNFDQLLEKQKLHSFFFKAQNCFCPSLKVDICHTITRLPLSTRIFPMYLKQHRILR